MQRGWPPLRPAQLGVGWRLHRPRHHSSCPRATRSRQACVHGGERNGSTFERAACSGAQERNLRTRQLQRRGLGSHVCLRDAVPFVRTRAALANAQRRIEGLECARSWPLGFVPDAWAHAAMRSATRAGHAGASSRLCVFTCVRSCDCVRGSTRQTDRRAAGMTVKLIIDTDPGIGACPLAV